MNVNMDKKQIIQKIVEIIETKFTKQGFENKRQRFFEKKEKEKIFQYEIDLGKPKGHFSLHLKLNILDKSISSYYNTVMKKVLTDKDIIFPKNWSQKDIEFSIKTRSSVKTVAMLTDWRNLKEESESLEDFNSKYSIWLYAFDELNEKKDWKEQFLLSVDLAVKWFNKAKTDEYLIQNTDLFGLCILKMKGSDEEIGLKFNKIKERMKNQKQDTKEVELFFSYLKG